MDKEIVKAVATKFSENFAISMLKKHRKFCRRGLTHLDATLTFKNRPSTYAPPCKLDPLSKLATGEPPGKEARLLAQELRPVLTFLAARVNERHLRLSLFFFE